MSDTEKLNFITGLTDIIVLSMLNKRDCYGYEIQKKIEEFSNGELILSLNTIYTVTYKLEEKEMISEYSILVGKRRRRSYYKIEKKGLDYLNEQLLKYRQLVKNIDRILTHISEKEF